MLSRGEALRPDHASAHPKPRSRAQRAPRARCRHCQARLGSLTLPHIWSLLRSPARASMTTTSSPSMTTGVTDVRAARALPGRLSSDRRVRSLVTHRASTKHVEWHRAWRLDHDVLYAAEQRAREAAAAKQRRAAAHAAMFSRSAPKGAVNAASREVIRAAAELPSSPAMGNSSAALPSPAAADAQAPAVAEPLAAAPSLSDALLGDEAGAAGAPVGAPSLSYEAAAAAPP